MPAPMEAELGWGVLYEIDNGADPAVFEEYGRVMDIDHADPIADDVDATHMRSANRTREYIQGLTDPGEFSVTMFWEPGSATDDALHTLKASGVVRQHRLTFLANTHSRTVNGYIKSLKPGTPIDDKSTLVVTVKLSGDITRGNA